MLTIGALLVHMSAVVMSQTVIYLEPPNCTHKYVLKEGETVYLDSSRPYNSDNREGECSVQLENKNHSKHLNYRFEIGPNITDCSAELIFEKSNPLDMSTVQPLYTCSNLHPYRLTHSDNWTGIVKVKRKYVTMRKDFFFRIQVIQVEPFGEHEDSGLGIYVDRSETEPSVPIVLYIILALDFLLPTAIFIANEFSGRRSDDSSNKEDSLHRKTLSFSQLNPAFPTTGETTPVTRRHKKAAIGANRQDAFQLYSSHDTIEHHDVKGLFPFYKQPSEIYTTTQAVMTRPSKTVSDGEKLELVTDEKQTRTASNHPMDSDGAKNKNNNSIKMRKNARTSRTLQLRFSD